MHHEILLRKALKQDLDAIYLMGYDVWSEGLSQEEYLLGCQNGSKYKLGDWYVLLSEDKPAASLIVYFEQFGLVENCYGIGSVATNPEMRKKGYASHLIKSVTEELFVRKNTEAVFLHSDIDPRFYEKLGYQRISQTNCMYQSKNGNEYEGSAPSYF